MLLTFLASILVVWALVAGLIQFIGRRRRWSTATQGRLQGGAGIAMFVALFVTLITPFMLPVEAWAMQWKLAAIERHLYVGESRAEVEAHFGHDVPAPDRKNGYAAASRYAVPGWGDHLGQYMYDAGGALCVNYYRGVVVFYDVHDRVKFWKEYGSGDGC